MNHKPKLVCLTFDYPPMKGGVARYLSNLVEASDGAIEVIAPLEHPHENVEGSGLRVQRVRFWWSLWPKWLPLIKRCLEIPKDKMVLVSHALPVGTAAWIAKLLGGPDYAVIFHGTDLKRINTAWKKFLLNKICKSANLLIANSQATSDALKRFYSIASPLILTPGISVCHSRAAPATLRWRCGRAGGNPDLDPRASLPAGKVKPEDDKNNIRKNFSIAPNEKVILSVARLVERKGIDTLISAAPEILKKHNDTKFVVIGDGPYFESLEILARINSVPIIWIRNASDQEVQKWYAASDIFCLPAREEANDVEGFGIVFLEAAAAGLPVVAGKGWGTAEAVDDGKTGYLIHPSADQVAERIIKLLDDPQLARQLGQAGRERAISDFKWEDRWRALAGSLGYWQGGQDIAVVIPCWDHAQELESTLKALEKQTLQPREIVVVDDASTDDPKAVIDKFHNLKISYIRFEANQGAPAARNKGAQVTTAPFIMFLDADAELAPCALARMRTVLELHPDFGFVYSNFKWGDIVFKSREFSLAALEKMNYIHTTALIRRKDWPGFDESLKKFQDWDLWLTMARKGVNGLWLDQVLLTIKERKRGLSRWLPSFMYKMPWPILGWTPQQIQRYRDAEMIIREKHKLS